MLIRIQNLDFRITFKHSSSYFLLTGNFKSESAHFIGMKLPLLFVYYDTPFYAYQDKIISFAVVSYAALFYSAARHRAVVPAALFVLGVTVLGLASVNMSSALESVLKEGQSRLPYWLQTGVIGAYFVLLLVFYMRDRAPDASSSK